MKKIKKISTIILAIIIIAVAGILGYIAGNTINGKYFIVDKYASLTRENYSDDISTIKYEGKSPDEFTPIEVYLISLKHSTSKNYTKHLTGEILISVGITQSVEAISTRKDNVYSFTNISSSSLYSLAERCTYSPNEPIRIQKGKLSGSGISSVSWTDKYEEYEYEEFAEILGREPTNQCQYIVSSKTATDYKLVSKENGKYTYEIVLDPFYATFCYVNEIAHNSGVDKSTITFKALNLKFTIDESFNIIEQYSTEVYDLVYSGIPVQTTTNFHFTMEY